MKIRTDLVDESRPKENVDRIDQVTIVEKQQYNLKIGETTDLLESIYKKRMYQVMSLNSTE